MFCVYTEVMAKDETVTFEKKKNTPQYQLLHISKVDRS